MPCKNEDILQSAQLYSDELKSVLPEYGNEKIEEKNSRCDQVNSTEQGHP